MTTTARPRRRLLMISALALLVAAAVAPAQSQWAPVSGQVTRAIDGDSIEVNIGDRLEIVRYAGISTPYIQHPTRGPEHYREVARAANAWLAAGKPVQLVFDVQPRDRAGRLLAYVYAGSSFVNAELVGAGYAEVATYPPNVRHRETFMTRQREARQAKRGFWADSDVAQHHRFRAAGVYGNTRLKVYFHPDDGARNILLADPFVHFESPEQAAAAGYRPSMDYAVFARREQQILSGNTLPTTAGAPAGGTTTGTGIRSAPTSSYSPPGSATMYVGREQVAPPPPYGYNPPSYSPYGSSPRPSRTN
jgi:micrococcal nuclease